MKGSAGDGEILFYRQARNAAKNVDAEFETERMDVAGERLEAGVVLCGRDRVGSRGEATKFIEAEFRGFCIDSDGMVGDVPTHVDRDVLPAEGLQIFGHELCATADVGFGDGFTVGVPTVPAHGRTGSDLGEIDWRACCCFGVAHQDEREKKREHDERAADEWRERASEVHVRVRGRWRWCRAREAEKRKN